MMECVDEIDKYFKSSNEIPVTRATIKIEEWLAVKAYISKLELDVEFYSDPYARSED